MKSIEQLQAEYDQIMIQAKIIKQRTIHFGSFVLVITSILLLKLIVTL